MDYAAIAFVSSL